MEHQQPPTAIRTDTSIASGFVNNNNNIQMKRSKSWDMNFYWLRDKKALKEFNIIWEKRSAHDVDYFTKHHATVHHRAVRPQYIRDCINIIFTKLINTKSEG